MERWPEGKDGGDGSDGGGRTAQRNGVGEFRPPTHYLDKVTAKKNKKKNMGFVLEIASIQESTVLEFQIDPEQTGMQFSPTTRNCSWYVISVRRVDHS